MKIIHGSIPRKVPRNKFLFCLQYHWLVHNTSIRCIPYDSRFLLRDLLQDHVRRYAECRPYPATLPGHIPGARGQRAVLGGRSIC